MHISAILKDKGDVVHSTSPDQSLQGVVDTLLGLRISSLVVLSPTGELLGIVTERDIVRTLKSSPDTWMTVRVEEVMTRELYVAGPDDSLGTVIREMRERHIRHLPVIVDGKLAGVLSIRDLIASSMTELERHNDMLKRYINDWPQDGPGQ
ncbi:CBS domain-containing protein [Marinihelvus fidelis]|uniref:CBS domain-containing protein n=1 Tax=Marinihelvus fidelis TaxID=2613842 RepID=A0A5N0TLH3_9GAMM|nr:CBS domain-containing protein [Marinihelvus fidelis]KAA9134179.1 CBS domain-containing protein [Marinihelvus fidelis]